MFRALLALALMLSVAAAHAAEVEAEQPWIRAAPPSAMMLAGYVVLHNRGDDSIQLVGVSSERFGLAEVHETVEIDGVARMREVPSIAIAPRTSVALEPGGRHVMLMRPKSVPAEGEQVTLGLKFSDGSELPVVFEVRRAAP